MRQFVALKKLGAALFGSNNLTGTDFKDVTVQQVSRDFQQGDEGVRIQFTVSSHALGKVLTAESDEALEVLLASETPPDS